MMRIGKNLVYELFIYFLCFSFFLWMSTFPRMTTEAKEIGFPIGEMVSRGDVKFEAKANEWKSIEFSHFPIFQKGRIKTQNGTGVVTLANNCQVEVDQNTVLFFDQADRIHLSQGNVNFRIPSKTDVMFKVGNLTVTKTRVMQAAESSATTSPKSELAIGSISLRPNGSVTVKSLQGSLSILNEDRVVLAALSSKESITIPSIITASGKSKTMVAQAGEIKEVKGERKDTGDEEWRYLGLNAIEWIAVGYAAALVGVLAYVFWPEGEEGENEQRAEQAPAPAPLCP
jgi:hypothetical protein